jgi:hypothetical protein
MKRPLWTSDALAAPRVATPWSAKRLAEAAFFLLFLAVQTAVPLAQLWKPRPARFGWQMYSGTQKRARFAVILRDGTTQRADLVRYVAVYRGEIDMEEAFPPHLCRVVPDAAAVQITPPDSGLPRLYKCP